MSSVAVIVLAAGKSTRFAGREKKPFVSLDGRPIWQRSAELFWTREDVTRVYLVVAAEDRDDFRSRYAHLIAFANVEVVCGGEERFDSVANGLACVPESVPFVAVHDAARPLGTTQLVDAVFAMAIKHGAAIPAVPVADTLKRVDTATNRIMETVPRLGLWQAQTPQVFRTDWLREAYARRAEFGAVTDDSQLVEAIGQRVYVVPGSSSNFKITTKDDLELAETIVKSRVTKRPAGPALGFGEDAKW